MLRHQGSTRTFKNNLMLAVLLSLTAGSVNAIGLLWFTVFTTNVTGHVGLFAKAFVSGNYYQARILLLWLFLFFFGAFICSWLIDTVGRRYEQFRYVIPMLVEIMLLVFAGYYGHNYDNSIQLTEILAGSLLLAMGIQNAMVTMISGAVIRTTHLTGLFTDLGIELSHLLFSGTIDKKSLQKSIALRLSIILSFFSGGIFGAIAFTHYHYWALGFPVLILLTALFYDSFLIQWYKIQKKFRTLR